MSVQIELSIPFIADIQKHRKFCLRYLVAKYSQNISSRNTQRLISMPADWQKGRRVLSLQPSP